MNKATKVTKITVTPNSKDRTFTIRKYYTDSSITKYRTIKMTPEEFNSSLNDTINDWKQFLKSTDDYYEV